MRKFDSVRKVGVSRGLGDKMTSRTFMGFLILNFKTGQMRVRTRKVKKSELSPFEIVVNVNIKIDVPEQNKLEVKEEFILPDAKVRDIVAEML